MNAQRRKQIEEIKSKIEDLQGEIENLQAEEQETFDNMPESLQSSERGEAASQAADNLQSAVGACSEVLNYLEEAA